MGQLEYGTCLAETVIGKHMFVTEVQLFLFSYSLLRDLNLFTSVSGVSNGTFGIWLDDSTQGRAV